MKKKLLSLLVLPFALTACPQSVNRNLKRVTCHRITDGVDYVSSIAEFEYNDKGLEIKTDISSYSKDGDETFRDIYEYEYREDGQMSVETNKVHRATSASADPFVAGKKTYSYTTKGVCTGFREEAYHEDGTIESIETASFSVSNDGLVETVIYGNINLTTQEDIPELKSVTTFDQATKRILKVEKSYYETGWKDSFFVENYVYDDENNTQTISGYENGVLEQTNVIKYDSKGREIEFAIYVGAELKIGSETKITYNKYGDTYETNTTEYDLASDAIINVEKEAYSYDKNNRLSKKSEYRKDADGIYQLFSYEIYEY